MDDLTVFYVGIAVTLLFIIGYGMTIYEFNTMEEEDTVQEPYEPSETKVRDKS